MSKIKHKPSLLFPVVYWVLAAFYYVTVRYSPSDEYSIPGLSYQKLLGYATAVGFSIGLLFGLFPLNPLFSKRKTFLAAVLTGTVSYVLFFMIIIFFASLYGNTWQFASFYVFSSDGLSVLFHLSSSSLFYHFILQINRKFGPGVLLEYTFGRYFKPKVEERAFMFLDLRSSTNLAEKLRHISYSRLIQDCYAELSGPLVDHKAQVYQYVGDEVVISWKMGRSFSPALCYDFFYAFRKRFEARRDYYLETYGVCPEFKAGIHCGKVTVAEVGETKTEIAYHGDTLNTASRIQGLCNQYQEDLLASESFVRHIYEKDHDRVKFIAELALRGKEYSTRIFAIAGRPCKQAMSAEIQPDPFLETSLA